MRSMRHLIAVSALLLAFAPVGRAQQAGVPEKAPATTEKPTGVRTKRAVAKEEPVQKRVQGRPWEKIPIPRLPAFKPQKPIRVELPNGMVLFLQEDHELPLIDLTIRIRGGSRSEPVEKIGMVDIYGEVWRTGGTKTRTGDQLDDFLEARAAKVETGGDVDSTSIGLSSLKQDFDAVFAVMMELLRDPAFREDKIDLAKRQMYTGISRRNDDIASVAGRESTVVGYGKENPYARYPEYATVAAVTQQNLIEWHRRHVGPNNMILGVVGDFDARQMEAKLRDAFTNFPKAQPVESPKIEFRDPKPGFYFVPKEDVNQSAIRMVALGIRRDNPDYFALVVMNEVFGGGFSSRLFKTIRTQQGLAYSVAGGVGAAFDHPGLIRLSMGTKTATTAEAIKSLYEQVDAMVKMPPTPDELRFAKDSILNAFVFRFDSPEKVLLEQMAYEFYGYPADFLDRYRAGVEKTTAADVHRVAQKYLKRSELAVLVVGQPEVQQQLAKLGSVSTIDITIPPPPGAQPATAGPKPGATSPQAKALAEKVVAAMGGAEKLQSVKATRVKVAMQHKTETGERSTQTEVITVYPDRQLVNLQTQAGPAKLVVKPGEAFMVAPGAGVRDLPPSFRDSVAQDLKRDEVAIAQRLDDPKLGIALTGKEKIGEAEAVVMQVNADGAVVNWWVDPNTGRILRKAYSTMGLNGPVQRVVDFAEWRSFDGLTLPSKGVVTENGQQSSSVQVLEYAINPPVDAALFQKPAQGGTVQ